MNLCIVDSHCHLNMLKGDIDDAIAAAHKQGVCAMLNVSVSLETAETVISTAEKYPNVFASIGVHLCYKEATAPSMAAFLPYKDRVIAVGETGLDFFHTPKAESAWQYERFITQIEISNAWAKPIIIHCRNAGREVVETLRAHHASHDRAGIMHCFAESIETARTALDLGFYISFSGILTFKNARALREIAAYVPADRLLVETDAPYLAPEPHRSKPNTPAYTYHTLETLARVRGTPLDEMAARTTQNFCDLFGLDLASDLSCYF